MSAYLSKAEGVVRRVWPPIVLCVALLVTWLVFQGINNVYWTSVAVKFFITVIVVLGLQMFSGNSGVLSFGHVAFMAVGAYTSAFLTIPLALKQISFPHMPHFLRSWIFPTQLGTLDAVLVGGGFALAFAILTAAPVARLAGVAAGIATLAIIVIVNVFINETPSVTNGTETTIGVPLTTTLSSVAIWSLIFVVVAFAFQQSRVGLRLRASRENDRAARSVGVRVIRDRAVAWIISGFVVGVAGALYGHYFTTFSGTDFYFNNGLDLVLLTVAMLVVGGMTSVTGAITGCFVVTIVYTIFNRWETVGYFGYTPPSGISNLAVAVLLLLALIARPRGLTNGREVPWVRDWNLRRIWSRRAREEERPAVAADTDGPAPALPADGQIQTQAGPGQIRTP
jgi:branched-chain amino acid transport system permease protein